MTDWELQPEPEQVVDIRRRQQEELEVLVMWKDLPDLKNFWEPVIVMKAQFPSFLLRTRRILRGRGVMMQTSKKMTGAKVLPTDQGSLQCMKGGVG